MIKKMSFTTGVITAVVLLATLITAGCPVEEPGIPAGQVKFAADYAFLEDKAGLPALEEMYGFQFDEVYGMALGLTHEALWAGDVDAAKGFATDAKIKELSLVSLEDDRGFFPVFYSAPVIREEILEQYPEIDEIMSEIAVHLDNETMINLNYLVDIKRLDPDDVARDWLLETGLVSGTPSEPVNEDPVIIGLKESTEQKILGCIAVTALEYASIPVVKYFPLVGDPDYRSKILKGTIHLYWEHTGNAWSDIYGDEEIFMDPEKVYGHIAAIDAGAGLVWLDFAPFNNTCAIMMRLKDAEALDITTISQLAAWIKMMQDGVLEN